MSADFTFGPGVLYVSRKLAKKLARGIASLTAAKRLKLAGGKRRPLPPYTDPIRLGDAVYARNSRGLHVPIESLTPIEQIRAPKWLWHITGPLE